MTHFACRPKLGPCQGSITSGQRSDAESGDGDCCPSVQPPHALLMCRGDVEGAELGGGHAGGRWDSHICSGCKCLLTGPFLQTTSLQLGWVALVALVCARHCPCNAMLGADTALPTDGSGLQLTLFLLPHSFSWFYPYFKVAKVPLHIREEGFYEMSWQQQTAF